MSTQVSREVDISALVEQARAAQRLWSQLPLRKRLQCVRQFRHLLTAEQDALCRAVQEDTDKPAIETIACELLPLGEACRFLQKQAPRLLRPRRVPLRQLPTWLYFQSDQVHRRPRGVIGIIGTWNYPLFLNGVQILQALTAGNAVIWKPSEVTPRSAEALAALLKRAGLADGVLQVLPATREMGRTLADADVDHIVFTGHADTGRRLAESLGRRLITSTLELSGCDAMFVLDDANVRLAARAAWFGATLNRGQTCLAVRRAYVAKPIYESFLTAIEPLARAATRMKLGLPAQAQQAEELVQDALDHGARLIGVEDTNVPTGEFRPVALANATPDMAVCHAASFAPLMAVIPFDQVEDALAADAQCPYALGASIFTSDVKRGTRLAGRLRPGTVSINDVIAPTGHPATPFGGQGASGWGVTQGAEGLLEMTVPQVVSIRAGTWRPHYDPPGSTRLTSLGTFQAMLRWGHAGSWRERLAGFFQLIRALRRSTPMPDSENEVV
jgi:acyl-CoA reductase-like NAD-dependent aldehyde dehydrogenase